ncbi:MAG: hypothetical protein JNK66_14150 [Chitinophagales bacterium]|nr:hypothetical protein [Chitinophagales bacterium]
MKKQAKFVQFSIMFFATLLLLSSCKKETINNPTKQPTLMQQSGGEVFLTTTGLGKQALGVVSYMINNRLSKKTNGDGEGIDFEGSCATVTYDTLADGYRATLDFGTTGCYDYEGKLYTGTIVVEYNTDDMGMAGAFIKSTFTNFTIDTFRMNGIVSVENKGTNAVGNKHGEIIANVQLTQLSTNEVYNASANIHIQDPGDEAQIDGNISLTEVVSGNSVSLTGVETVIHPYNTCDNPVSGKVLKQETGADDELTDFGNGTCDNFYTITVNGVTTNYEFE